MYINGRKENRGGTQGKGQIKDEREEQKARGRIRTREKK